MDRVYRHYGSSTFDISKFVPIRNRSEISCIATKPYGGLWASPIDSDADWYNWCLDNDFCIEELEKYFDFTLKDNSKIISIEKLSDLNQIKGCYATTKNFYNHVVINFEALVESGYDAIDFLINSETYWFLYGWDVDSLLVLNPDCIVLKESSCMTY